MSTLLLRLAGPMQSWGDASRFTRRSTRHEPTKSGVLGLLAAAQGRRRTDPIEDLVRLRFGVRIDQPGQLVRDFHTAHRPDGSSMPLSVRYYLSDAIFVAGVEGDRQLLESLDDALRAPTFPLYLGRRACPPSGKLSLGLVDSNLEQALREFSWCASTWYRRMRPTTVSLPLLLDAAPGISGDVDTEVVRDVPVSFDPVRREYGWRDVARAEPVAIQNALGRDALDFFSVVEGA